MDKNRYHPCCLRDSYSAPLFHLYYNLDRQMQPFHIKRSSKHAQHQVAHLVYFMLHSNVERLKLSYSQCLDSGFCYPVNIGTILVTILWWRRNTAEILTFKPQQLNQNHLGQGNMQVWWRTTFYPSRYRPGENVRIERNSNHHFQIRSELGEGVRKLVRMWKRRLLCLPAETAFHLLY